MTTRSPSMRFLARITFVVLAMFLPVLSASSDEKTPPSKSLEGLWAGTLKTGLVDLRLAVKITKKDDAYAGTMDSIDQGAKAIPIESIEVKDGAVTLRLRTVGGVFEGKLKEDGSEIAGKWKQGGGSLDLTLKRTDKAPEVNRPQYPKKPYPYAEHEVGYASKADGIKLAGTLTVPRGDGP